MKKLLVTAATGHLGDAVVDFLATRVPAHAVAAMTRDVTKAESLKAKGIQVREGDYFDKASLSKAFEGIDTLLFISSGSLENRVRQHLNVVEAAKAGGVKHIIYTGIVKSDPASKFPAAAEHYDTEEAIKKSGIAYTFFRDTLYAEVVPMLLGDALSSGHWYYAAGNAKVNFASRLDMAEAIANVLAAPQAHVNRVYEITSGKAYTFADIANAISKIAGKTVTYTAIGNDAQREALMKSGLPVQYVPLMAGMAEAIAEGEFDVTDPALEILLNRKPADLLDYLAKLLKAGK